MRGERDTWAELMRLTFALDVLRCPRLAPWPRTDRVLASERQPDELDGSVSEAEGADEDEVEMDAPAQPPLNAPDAAPGGSGGSDAVGGFDAGGGDAASPGVDASGVPVPLDAGVQPPFDAGPGRDAAAPSDAAQPAVDASQPLRAAAVAPAPTADLDGSRLVCEPEKRVYGKRVHQKSAQAGFCDDFRCAMSIVHIAQRGGLFESAPLSARAGRRGCVP